MLALRRTTLASSHTIGLGRSIGAGGMGAGFEATDRRDGSRVAIKLLHPSLANDPGFRERFEREAHVAALLRSRYTVHVLDFGAEDGSYYLVMELIEGHTVAESLRDGGPPPDRALRVALSVAGALEEAEARGVVRRDIKPENVMSLPDGSVKLADFGIARPTAPGSALTRGGFIGALEYAAPEQFAGGADRRTDIYQLGATLYAMLVGEPPYRVKRS